MSRHRANATLLLLFVFLAISPILPQTAPSLSDAVLFTVESDKGSLSVQPIAVLSFNDGQNRGALPKLHEPIPLEPDGQTTEEEINKAVDAAAEKYMRAGRVVAVFAGGQRLGTATIGESVTPGGGCMVLDAPISLSYSGSSQPFLASTADRLVGHPSSRRRATFAERTVLKELARQWFRGYGLSARAASGAISESIISSTVRPGAGRALIGRFDLDQGELTYHLFAVAESDGRHHTLRLAELSLEHNLSGKDTMEREYIDQLDLNNDGSDEFVTRNFYYENWKYTVFSYDTRRKTWRTIFDGGRGGC
jgi:hypothetical protein